MSTATSGDFLGGGGDIVDPFKGRAPMTLAEQAAAEDAKRRRLLAEQSARTRNTNNAPGGYTDQRAQETQDATDASNARVVQDRIDRDRSGDRLRLSFGEALSEDPVTMGILAAPYGVVGAGAALGGAAGLGFGLGEGTIAAGGAAGLPAGMTTAGGVTGGTMAAPALAGGGAAAAGGAAGAAAGGGLAPWIAPAIGGLAAAGGSYLLGEATGGRTDEEKKLLQKQEQLAAEAEQRRYAVQEQHMNALGQQLLAFNPRNQMMASMFGPEAAFAPTDFAQMAQNTAPPPQLPPELQMLQGQASNNPEAQAKLQQFILAQQQYEAGNQQRGAQMMNSMAPPGAGPAPLDPRTPQAARKY